ncbi:UNKNOWN [Stylonychia lemnae]|uniref:Methyltransferase FkbM domain-containing protein n=1 Tax=Stylonychia lemnae TaxID=5949 RepID=A0A078A2T3_STYLE|nr:UNKNOWN [Stylonychia lemnae]|eukprot:CDW76137.1 UNKNOWN [Stylonychia lemnae]
MLAQRVLFIILSCYLSFLNSCKLSQYKRTLRQEDSLCREQAGIQEGGIHYEVISIKAKNGYKAFKFITVRPQKNMRHTDSISRWVFRYNSWEDENSIQIVNALKMVSIQYPDYKIALLDIGANLGWYTFVAASLGYNVIAFEPFEQNYKAIEYGICRNQNIGGTYKNVRFVYKNHFTRYQDWNLKN